MKPKLFISYSRCQTPFVDRLAGELEKSGFSLWLDYHSLVPARPWYQQIEAGVNGADVILLVVSRESIASPNVAPEWKLALALKKRIILLICEAVSLPEGLQCCEWVDMRVWYKRSVRQLKNLLENPSLLTSPPPQKGFKAPTRFWVSLALSILVLIGSIPTWWTVVVPYILVPLPWQLYKRNYIFSRVVSVLLLMPVFSLYTYVAFLQEGNILYSLQGYGDSWLIPIFLTSWVLLALLLTPDMQRRGLPQAARVTFANPLTAGSKNPRSVIFAIDHAAEDGRYADDLRRGLERHGHRLAGPDETPEAVFVLISTYKKTTQYDPEQQAVYPVILQAVGDIDPALQRVQWIDFRKGIHNLDKLATLLPEPQLLLKALAVPPTGAQEIIPLPVNALLYFYLITGILSGAALLDSISSLMVGMASFGIEVQEALLPLSFAALSALLMFGSIFLILPALRQRKRRLLALYPLLILTAFQIAIRRRLYFFAFWASASPSPSLINASAGLVLDNRIFSLGLGILILILFFRWKDLYRWLPLHNKASIDPIASALLLYTPSRRSVLFLHTFFHSLMLLFYLLLGIFMHLQGVGLEGFREGIVEGTGDPSVVETYTTVGLRLAILVFGCCFVPGLFGLRWWARRLSN